MSIFADYHTHCAYSGDSETPMEEMIQQAIKIGLKELVFTDHVDFDYADPGFENIDYKEYFSTFKSLQDKYQKQIRLLAGVEVGFQPHVKDRIERFLAKFDFDFIICSTHMADHLDFYNGDFFVGKDQKNAYLRYFENVLEAVKTFQGFDVYGHLDFIVRYGNYANKSLSYYDYQDLIDQILRNTIENGHGIEVNTSGFRYHLNQFHPQMDILKRYRQLGGEIITLGSDAHIPCDIASHFTMAYTMLKDLGFNYLAAYGKRQNRFVSIP